MNNLFLKLFTFVVLIHEVSAQQISLFNHYMINPYLINPARAGEKKSTNAFLIHRQQWTGIPGAPITDLLTIDGTKKSEKIGLGITISNDISNIINKTSVMGTYAYHGKINENHKFSLGLSAGVLQNRIQFDKVITDNYTDKTLLSNLERGTTIDANFGGSYQWKKLDIGFAVNQLFGNKITYSQESKFKEVNFRNLRHYLITAGYSFSVYQNNIKIDPMLLVRTAQGLPAQVEIANVIKYKNIGWINLGYRHQSATSIGFGINALDNFSIGYIYEYPTTRLNKFQANTHEILISYKFRNTKSQSEEFGKNSDLQNTDNILQLQEQYDQLQLRVKALADEIKQNIKEQESLKNELVRQQLAEEKIVKELEKDREDEVDNSEDFDKVDINLPESFDNEKFDYFVVIGAYHGLSHAKHFQKTIKKGKGIDAQIVKAKNSAFYFVYTSNVTSKKEANAELARLNKINFNEFFKSRIWIHKEPK